MYDEGDFDYYFFDKNVFGDIVGIYNENGRKICTYTYDAWGVCETTLSSGISSTERAVADQYNPFRYRGYYYDVETGYYYLQTRYYNPEWGRFLNADGYVNANGDILGYNMFAYCSNNPIMGVDPTGQFFEEFWNVFVQTLQQSAGYFAVAAGVSQLDTIAPGPADVASIALLIGGLIVCAGIATYTVATAPAVSLPKAEEKVKEDETPKSLDSPIVFPNDPNAFNPVGLVKVPRTGTKNGSFVSWMDPVSNVEVFRWDENPNYSNGSHYHIYSEGHYYPGTPVPEPYASIYFPR